jgi:rare lipoprotein A
VRINDRGPFVPGRIVDLSKAAAEELGMVGRGIARVKLEVVDEIEVANAIH